MSVPQPLPVPPSRDEDSSTPKYGEGKPRSHFHIVSAAVVGTALLLQVVAVGVQEWVSVGVNTDLQTHPTFGKTEVAVMSGLFRGTFEECCRGSWKHTSNTQYLDYCPQILTTKQNCIPQKNTAEDSLCPHPDSNRCSGISRGVKASQGLTISTLLLTVVQLVVLLLACLTKTRLPKVICAVSALCVVLSACVLLVWALSVKDALKDAFAARYGGATAAYQVQSEAAFFVYLVATMLMLAACVLNACALWVALKESQAVRRAYAVKEELGVHEPQDPAMPGFSKAGRELRAVTGPNINPVITYFPPVNLKRHGA